jgi:uncharacterized damage-inducible protein DinB
MTKPEPWLRGPLAGVPPLLMPVLFTFAQVREDLAEYIHGLTSEQLWRSFPDASLGFHLKHIAGSVDRLVTYLLGSQLSPEQLAALRSEQIPDANLPQLLAAIERSLEAAEIKLKTIDPEDLYEPRSVGRRALPTTVLGLIVHLAEHTQRHLGQAITLSKLLRQPD